MKNTYVVGDIHGRTEVVDKMLSLASDDTRIVFVGDYLDSYHRPIEDSIYCFDTVCKAIDSGMNVTGLLGNHELSYMMPGMQCSGFNHGIFAHLANKKIKNNLEEYTWVGNHLITHAGVSAHWFEQLPDITGEADLVEYILHSQLRYAIGYSRGGSRPVGGIFWCDFFREFKPLDTIPQVVGHSRTERQGSGTGIIKRGNSFCIDCLEDPTADTAAVLYFEDEKDPQSVKFSDL